MEIATICLLRRRRYVVGKLTGLMDSERYRNKRPPLHRSFLLTNFSKLYTPTTSSFPMNRTPYVKPGPENFPLTADFYDYVPMPIITQARNEGLDPTKVNACRLVRDVTQSAPSFATNPVCFTLPDSPDIFNQFISAMQATVGWVRHKKGPTGRPQNRDRNHINNNGKTVGRPRVHNYSWTYHCPRYGQADTTGSSKTNPIVVPSQEQTTALRLPSHTESRVTTGQTSELTTTTFTDLFTTTVVQHMIPKPTRNPTNNKKRKRDPSIKCGCGSKFTVCRRECLL